LVQESELLGGGRIINQVLVDDGMCFGCGKENPIGLKLTFEFDGEIYSTRYTPDKTHQGWSNRTHGGMLALVLDEVLTRVVLVQHGLDWFTVELTTRLIRPAPVGEPLEIRGKVEAVRGRLITATGEVIDAKSGQTIATGYAKLMRAK
jgi:acyl-coenzyme A thioesterase PaaI-like protein